MTSVKEVTTFTRVHLEEKCCTVQSNYSDQLVIIIIIIIIIIIHTTKGASLQR